ncbi:TRAP transporter substrate-binding protein [Roseococcus pinisoli]|uniref:TRAP transporter substrate-binding protein n=1 Tax=Roseococcus pinisoli TaxID=2835040 RepID=A0ABS5QAT8_9PROT|nr:TRAP transporter substrate-binding protein [Roseococcus pinisoli]MBS7810810.1 TRAP transporter substrate-binding protein [Roseococcus pinisoli]
MHSTHRRALLAGAGFAIIGRGLGSAQAQGRTVIRVGWPTGDGAQDPYAIGARAFKEEAEKLSNNRIEVQLFPNRALGDERPMLDGLRLGTVDMAVITNAVIAQIEPAFQINDMPFLFTDEAAAQRALDGEMGASLAQRLERRGVVSLGYMEGGFRQMVNNVRPIARPADVRGVKFRVLQSPIYVGMYTALGGTAVPMAWGETFTAVQQGTIDGLEIPLAVIDANRYDEVTKYLSLTNHIYSMIGLLMGKRNLDRLPADLRDVVRAAATAATAKQRTASITNARQITEGLRGKGMQVNAVTDPAEFRQAVLPMYESFRGAIGAEIVQQALAASR